MISAQQLVKWYGPVCAVDQLSFEIPAGQIVGFLGPNGAGKSTTLRILTGYLPPTSGKATIDGADVIREPLKSRSKIGYLPESTPLYPEMRVEEYLHYRGRLLNMARSERKERINIVCDRCGLAHNRRRLIGQLSKGNRQRVGIAQALLHNPPVLILDEPTSGLDPNQITEVRKLIAELGGDHTIILSSHILPEVEKSAQRVLIIAGGKLMADDSPEALRQKVANEHRRLIVEAKASPDALRKALSSIEGLRHIDHEAGKEWTKLTIQQNDQRDLREAVGKVLLTNQWHTRELHYEAPSLEQLFIDITASQAQAGATSDAAA